MSDNKYLSHALTLINKAKTLIAEQDWTQVSHSDDITLDCKDFPDVCDVHCYRANSITDKTPEQLANQVWNVTEQTQKTDDHDIMEWKVVEGGNNWRVFAQLNKLPWPLFPRQTLCAQMVLQEEEASNDIYWTVSYSIDHDKVSKQEDKYVRTKVVMLINKFEKVGNKTHIWRLSQVDPSGNIPKSVLNLYSSKIVTAVKKLKH